MILVVPILMALSRYLGVTFIVVEYESFTMHI